MSNPITSSRPSVLTATATILATDTNMMRQAWQTFR